MKESEILDNYTFFSHVGNALATLSYTGDTHYNGTDSLTIAVNDLERARAILARKYREPAATREERAKRMRFLQSRGFSHEVIYRLLSSSGRD